NLCSHGTSNQSSEDASYHSDPAQSALGVSEPVAGAQAIEVGDPVAVEPVVVQPPKLESPVQPIRPGRSLSVARRGSRPPAPPPASRSTAPGRCGRKTG